MSQGKCFDISLFFPPAKWKSTLYITSFALNQINFLNFAQWNRISYSDPSYKILQISFAFLHPLFFYITLKFEICNAILCGFNLFFWNNFSSRNVLLPSLMKYFLFNSFPFGNIPNTWLSGNYITNRQFILFYNTFSFLVISFCRWTIEWSKTYRITTFTSINHWLVFDKLQVHILYDKVTRKSQECQRKVFFAGTLPKMGIP